MRYIIITLATSAILIGGIFFINSAIKIANVKPVKVSTPEYSIELVNNKYQADNLGKRGYHVVGVTTAGQYNNIYIIMEKRIK